MILNNFFARKLQKIVSQFHHHKLRCRNYTQKNRKKCERMCFRILSLKLDELD